MKYVYVLIITMVALSGCAPQSLSKYCDPVQKAYMKANATAVAIKSTFPPEVWNTCVVPLDNTANDAVVACYRAAATNSVDDVIKALSQTAALLTSDYATLKGCKP